MNVSGETAIVTGGASGLGRACAELLASKGARVGVIDLNEAGAQEVARAVGGVAAACDVADAASGQAAVEVIVARLGAPRVLVHCAGIGPPKRVLGREGPMPLADFERIIRVNLIGTFNMIRLVAAHMAKLPALESGGRGAIVATASIAAYDGQIGQAAYAASKGGVVGMVLPIAREFAQHGIRVNAIAPGIFATPLLASLPQDAQDSLGRSVPHPARLGEPSEFAALVMHIVENEYMNGETIRIDGALRMAPR